MSWADAKLDANKRIAALQLPEGSLEGFAFTLPQYESLDLLRFDGHQGSLVYHQMVVRAMQRILRLRGATVIVVVVTLQHRSQSLHVRDDSGGC